MKYDMIVCDYDGTLRPYNSPSLPDRLLSAIDDYRKAGGRFVICTGREYKSIIKQLEAVRYEGELLCLQGSACFLGDKLIFNETLSLELTVDILKFAESIGHVAQLYDRMDYYVNEPNPETASYAQYTDVDGVFVFENLSDFARKNGICANKIIIHCNPSETKAVVARIKEKYGAAVEASQSTPRFAEVVSSKAGKGNGVTRLAEFYGIPLSKTVACGDATNDISMLKAAGLGVAVKDGMPEVIEAADYVCPTAAEGGVADVIKGILEGTI